MQLWLQYIIPDFFNGVWRDFPPQAWQIRMQRGYKNVKMVAGTINAFGLTQDNHPVSDWFTINDLFAPLEEDTGPLPWESFFSALGVAWASHG